MTNENILLFAQEYFKRTECITEYCLQKFILEQDEIGIALPLDDIRAALDFGYKSGKLSVVFANEEVGIYRLA
jgi:hypothetical protein